MPKFYSLKTDVLGFNAMQRNLFGRQFAISIGGIPFQPPMVVHTWHYDEHLNKTVIGKTWATMLGLQLDFTNTIVPRTITAAIRDYLASHPNQHDFDLDLRLLHAAGELVIDWNGAWFPPKYFRIGAKILQNLPDFYKPIQVPGRKDLLVIEAKKDASGKTKCYNPLAPVAMGAAS